MCRICVFKLYIHINYFRQVVSILSQVQESCSPDEAKLLDKVMEFLKREGLYSPQVKDMRTDDPVATDLIGALLTVIQFN